MKTWFDSCVVVYPKKEKKMYNQPFHWEFPELSRQWLLWYHSCSNLSLAVDLRAINFRNLKQFILLKGGSLSQLGDY